MVNIAPSIGIGLLNALLANLAQSLFSSALKVPLTGQKIFFPNIIIIAGKIVNKAAIKNNIPIATATALLYKLNPIKFKDAKTTNTGVALDKTVLPAVLKVVFTESSLLFPLANSSLNLLSSKIE